MLLLIEFPLYFISRSYNLQTIYLVQESFGNAIDFILKTIFVKLINQFVFRNLLNVYIPSGLP